MNQKASSPYPGFQRIFFSYRYCPLEPRVRPQGLPLENGREKPWERGCDARADHVQIGVFSSYF